MEIEKQIKGILEKPFWPKTIETGVCYQRYEDDSPNGYVSIVFGGDGDGYAMMSAEMDPNEHKFSFRFRMPMMGGGQSPRVRNALLILAEAIRLDNKHNPQHRDQQKAPTEAGAQTL